MGTYRTLYREAELVIKARLEARGQVHGSEVRSIFVELAQGRFSVDDHAERLLTEMVGEGALEHAPRAEPNASQAAFLGLQWTKKAMHAAGWAPGLRESYWYWIPGSHG